MNVSGYWAIFFFSNLINFCVLNILFFQMLIRLRESGRVLCKQATSARKKASEDSQETNQVSSQIALYKVHNTHPNSLP